MSNVVKLEQPVWLSYVSILLTDLKKKIVTGVHIKPLVKLKLSDLVRDHETGQRVKPLVKLKLSDRVSD